MAISIVIALRLDGTYSFDDYISIIGGIHLTSGISFVDDISI
jgi:hypothetical protein